MSDYGSAVERAHRAHAAISKIEAELERAPESRGLRINLLAMRRTAAQAEAYLMDMAQEKHVEICKYRLLSNKSDRFDLFYVARSLLNYQNLYTQVYDFSKYKTKKSNASFGKEAFVESALQVAYTYAGSLGVVLLAPSERGFFEGNLDQSIDMLFEVINVDSAESVRAIAALYGNAVVKRLFDWSSSNVEGGFSTDLRWSRSDGRQLGEVVTINRMERIVGLIEQSTNSDKSEFEDSGTLVGGDILSNSFHFVVPNGKDYRGTLSIDFDRSTELVLGNRYIARMREVSTLYLATEKTEIKCELLSLRPDG